MNSALPFIIREEKEEDFPEIYNLIKTAFKTANVSDGDEQDYAENLRRSENYIPCLALVAEYENQLIGHIMLTKTYIEMDDNKVYETLLLSPLSVLLEYRNKGVGGSLIKESIKLDEKLGYKNVFLCGDPEYYCRFGFRQSSIWKIFPKGDIPEQYVLGYDFASDSLNNISGKLECI